MKEKIFHETVPGPVGSGTASDLIHWIDRYARALFPENGVEYCTVHGGRPNRVGEDDPVPASIHHVACYVRVGNSDGCVIELALVIRRGEVTWLGFAKSFGSEDECWKIARAVTAAIEAIVLDGAVPIIVELADALPKSSSVAKATSYRGLLTVWHTETAVGLTDAEGKQLFHRIFDPHHAYQIPGYLRDLETVLTNFKANWRHRNYRIEASSSDPRSRTGHEHGNLADYLVTESGSEAIKALCHYHRQMFWVEVYDDATDQLLAGPFSPDEALPAIPLQAKINHQ